MSDQANLARRLSERVTDGQYARDIGYGVFEPTVYVEPPSIRDEPTWPKAPVTSANTKATKPSAPQP